MIKVKALSKTFDELRAVVDVSFSVDEGDSFALLGSNGSGKSTILKCLAGLVLPTGGEIVVNGIDVAADPIGSRKFISYLPQRVNFPASLTAIEVLRFYCRLRGAPLSRIDDVLKGSEFDFIGLEQKRVGDMSGGMVQRLGLAIACLADAPILLLDEPTASLDPEGAVAFRKFLRKLKLEGKTVFFSSHILDDVEDLADDVMILMKGREVACEPIEVLKADLNTTARLRVRVAGEVTPRVLEAIREVGASAVDIDGNDLSISSRDDRRLAILDALRSAGVKVITFETETSNLEEIYLRYARKGVAKSV